ncbi:hypothetical protein AJ88_44315 [Mesorhizobium amorphae CCBAU 01583]|nr:hypothetical protein AJ88_44315 [Mesorhizobium amorphae CCBAU 01583]
MISSALEQRVENELLVLDRFFRLRRHGLLGFLGVLAGLHGGLVRGVEAGFLPQAVTAAIAASNVSVTKILLPVIDPSVREKSVACF